MSWNANLPANSTPIRQYPTVLTDNFVAIETGDSSFQPDKINYQKQGGNPAAINNVIEVFSKNNGIGKTKLYSVEYDSAVAGNSVVRQISTVISGTTALPAFVGATNTVDLIDFSGTPSSFGNIYVFKSAVGSTSRAASFYWWNGTAVIVDQCARWSGGAQIMDGGSLLTMQASGTKITITYDNNAGLTVSWYYNSIAPEA